VDGKPRYDGVRDFMRSRGIERSEEQVRVIGDHKQALVERALEGLPPAPAGRVGERLRFRVQVRGPLIEVDLTREETSSSEEVPDGDSIRWATYRRPMC